jgi:hemoglobin
MNIDTPIRDGMVVGVAVDRFFRRLLADPALAPVFETAALHRLAAQQHAFLTSVLGGTYQGSPAPAVTAGPGTEAAVAEHLAEALREAGVPQPAVDAVTAAALRPPAPATLRPAAPSTAGPAAPATPVGYLPSAASPAAPATPVGYLAAAAQAPARPPSPPQAPAPLPTVPAREQISA